MLFVGNFKVESLNFAIKENEEELMVEMLADFLPINGTILEVGSNEGKMLL